MADKEGVINIVCHKSICLFPASSQLHSSPQLLIIDVYVALRGCDA